ncbi:MAG TPA: protein kinase [Pseudomonadota bacterium]|nr:protein kinase [Xanthomonadales bacterium]HQW82356.1 protein kinase [Pseudomonadota bacterium]
MIQIPGYLIKREIGAGGMATVYLAVQTSLEREVAIKVMNPAMISDPTFSRRFMQEARTLASLAHPNIVAVYDVGITDEKLHYFSMQHLPHGDFMHRIRDGISEREVLRIVAGVARALGYAHQRGFVHRDVAPGNVLFDVNGSPVLTDFGIARAVSKTSRITNAGVSVGTSHYMSPEQARGGDVDGRSDLYSLGAVSFEALTGHAPYEGDDGFAIAYAHVFEPIPRLPAHFQHWQPLIDRAMAKDPAQRYQNADELSVALSEIERRLPPPVDATQPLSLAAVQATVNMHAPTQAMPLPSLGADAAATMVLSAPAAPNEIGDELRQLREQAKATPVSVIPPPVAADGGVRRAGLWFAGIGITAAIALIGYGVWRGRVPEPLPPLPAHSDNRPPVNSVPVTIPKPQPPQPLPAETDQLAPPSDEDPSALALLGITEPGIDDQLRIALETTVVDPIAELLRLARGDIAGKRLTLPAGRNATDRYRLVLKIDRNNALASAGLVETAKALMTVADEQFASGKIDDYFVSAARAVEIAGVHDRDGLLRKSVDIRRKQLIDAALKEGDAAFERWDSKAALAAYARALHLDPANAAAKRGQKQSANLGQPGFVFSDRIGTVAGPELMVQRVGGKRLAVARNETTVAEFTRFWNGGGSTTRAVRPACRDRESIFRSSKTRTWQSPSVTQQASHPVVCVAWGDVDAYVAWLSKQTRKRYRAMTAAEWTGLAAQTADAKQCRANVADKRYNAEHRERDALACDDGFAGTAPVRHYDAPGGLYDMAGNVREWVSDCGSSCSSRVAMGSAWLSTADKLDPKQRGSFDADTGFNTIGFRVVREID